MATEGSVYRRKDGRWVAQYRDAKDKVRYVYLLWLRPATAPKREQAE